MHAEWHTSLTLQCNYDEVQRAMSLGYLVVDWYKIIRTWSDGTPDVRKKTWLGVNPVDGADHIWNATYAKVGYERVNNIDFSLGHSIRIKDVTLGSEGMYACKVEPEYGANLGYGVINVTVLGKIMYYVCELLHKFPHSIKLLFTIPF